jgi:hypothetical protein
MLIATKPPTISMENKNGGLWNSSIKKSAANKLVKTGWSIKPFNNFLNINFLKHLKSNRPMSLATTKAACSY